MRTVRVRLRATDLSREMVAMRRWLDLNRYEPTRFGCDQDGDDIVLSIGFSASAAAEAFAKHFDSEDGLPGLPPSATEESAPGRH
jgi:hypothetical protein